MTRTNEIETARSGGVLEYLSRFSGVLVFTIGASAGFVGNAIRTDAAVEIRLHAAEGQIETLKIQDSDLRANTVSQVQFNEVIKRLDQNIARIDENVQLLVEDRRAVRVKQLVKVP